MKIHENEIIGEMSAILRKPEVRRLQVNMIASNILNMVGITRNLLLQDDHYKEFHMPHNIYDWKMEPFECRMKDEHRTFLHLEDPRTLGVLKNLTDMDNFEELLRLILNDRERAMEIMEGCHDLLSIKEDLIRSHMLNQAICKTLSSKYDRLNRKGKAEYEAMTDKVHNTVNQIMNEAVVMMPIHQRYMYNSQLVHFAKMEYTLQQQEQMVEDDTTKYLKTIKRDENVFKEVMSYYSLDIDSLKNQLIYWSWKYDNDYEHINNRVSYNDLTLKSMRKQWDDCVERLEFYRSERKRFREEELREAREKARVSIQPEVVKDNGKRGKKRAKK